MERSERAMAELRREKREFERWRDDQKAEVRSWAREQKAREIEEARARIEWAERVERERKARIEREKQEVVGSKPVDRLRVANINTGDAIGHHFPGLSQAGITHAYATVETVAHNGDHVDGTG